MTIYRHIVLAATCSLLALGTGAVAHPFRNPLADPLKEALSVVDQERDLQTDLYILSQQRPGKKEAGSGDKLYWGNRGRKEIALTFDDGPHPMFVPLILRILAQHHAKATFFVIGEMAERYPDMVLAEAAAGHQVSNHTFHHARLNKVIPEMAGPEIEACDVMLERILKRPADRYFRPPGGEINESVVSTCRRLGKTPVMYTNDPQDFKNVGEKVLLDRLLKRIAPGGIILLHDNVKQTIRILPALLNALDERGYRCVTISQLDARRNLPPDSQARLLSASTQWAQRTAGPREHARAVESPRRAMARPE
ncbi:MAG TPA: polysaccharide deacetylase family protein [Armatimonadota bacterium]|jgi:peptidoglycan/xylan/chitin deacetylase (PgdA/CDA1 family)